MKKAPAPLRSGVAALAFAVGISSMAATLLPRAHAVTAPPGFEVENAFPGVDLVGPIQVVFLPDGRKLVAEQRGYVWTITPEGEKLETPFLDLRVEVGHDHDLGLLGAAIDPDFAVNRWVYIGYTVDPNADGNDNDVDRFCRVSRYQTDIADPDVADLASRQDLIGESWPTGIPTLHHSHSIGALRFAADKTLLVGAGDGAHHEFVDAGGHDPSAFLPDRTDPAEDLGAFRARSVNSFAGKILRIDKESGHGLPSNPYWDGDPLSDRSRVWSYGHRNPYRFAIRPGTGSADPSAGDPGVLYIGDVGWNDFEELQIVRDGGVNHGWPCFEGPDETAAYQAVNATEAGNDSILCDAGLNAENPAPDAPPALWWHRSDTGLSNPEGWRGTCAIGGVFYTGSTYPEEYHGRYFLADYGAGWIRAIEVDEDDNVVGWSEFIEDAFGPVDVAADPATGDLYYISIWDGEVRRIRYTVPSAVEEDRDGAPSSRDPLAAKSRPNPFRGMTRIEFEVPVSSPVSARIHDATGRLVRTILEARVLGPGRHSLEWDGRDDEGVRQSAGVYFGRIRIGEEELSRKIVLE